MSKVRIYGDTSGYVDIAVPAVAGTRTLNLDKVPQTATNGNTGIGTDNPSQNLHVSSADHTKVLITGGTDKYAELQFENDAQKFAMGVQDDDKFFLYNSTGTSQVLTVDTSSNVGINTQSPGSRKLKIVGSSSAYPLALDSTDTDYQLEFQKNGTSEWWLKASSTSFQIHENGVGDMLTVLSGGNVGIGTNNPNALLTVSKTASDHTSAAISIENTQNGGYGGMIKFTSTRTGSQVTAATIGTDGQSNWGDNSNTSSNLKFSTIDGNTLAERMRIKSDGRIGIGTNDPQYKLDIGHGSSGAIQARLKSSGDTGYTQGAMIIESSDSTSNPGNRGQGVYYYNVPNNRTWYGGTFYNNGNKFGFGYKNNAGLQTDAADTGNARMIIDGDAGNVFFNEIGNRGDITFPICSISNNGSGGNYLHAQFQSYGGAMFHIHYFGYDYTATIRQGSAGGYIYNTGGQSGAYAAASSGNTAAVYQTTTNRVEVVINTGSSNASNRWGSMVFYGGTDTITGNNPLTLVQYAWDNSTSRYYSS